MISKFLLFLSSRLAFLAFAFIAISFIPLREGYLGNQLFPNEPYFVWIWANFDGRHYLDIAINGYRNFNFAFFPLYPMLISLLHSLIGIPALYIGISISLLSLFAAIHVIYKIIRLDFDNKIANLTLFLLCIFPLSFFYQSVYPDSLFLLLSVLSFYFARRGNWLLAGLFGALTTLTRLSGLALLPALLVEWILQNKVLIGNWRLFLISFWKKGFIALGLTILGFLIYLLYLQVVHDDFLLFQKSMVAWRQDDFIFPPQVIFRYLKIFAIVDMSQLVYWVALLEFICMILYFALSFYVAKKVRVSYSVLMFFVFLLPTFTGTFAGMPRYILHTFPAFIGLALLLNKYRNLKVLMIITLLFLGLILAGFYTRGYFIG